MQDQLAIQDAVARMVDAVNRGDFSSATSCFTSEPVIVEDIAPFRWTGSSAVSDWLSAMGANAGLINASGMEMMLMGADRIEVQQDQAYACFPGNLSLRVEAGELSAQGTLTCVLVRHGGRWLIDALVWSGPVPMGAGPANASANVCDGGIHDISH